MAGHQYWPSFTPKAIRPLSIQLSHARGLSRSDLPDRIRVDVAEQNGATSRQAAHLDLQVDLLAEQELTLILYLLRAVCQKEGVSMEGVSERMRELLRETDVHEVAMDLDERLPEI